MRPEQSDRPADPAKPASPIALAPEHLLDSAAALDALYGAPNPNSMAKEVPFLHPHYHRFVEASPFVAVATAGPGGLDCSPRGDDAGFVRVHDTRTVMLPDRRGNNRVDTLRNLVADPRIALLFLIPGVGETLRINGTARISVDPVLLASFAVDGKPPRSVVVVDIDTVYFQCSRALARARLWDVATHIERARLPSTGTLIADIGKKPFDVEQYDRELAARGRDALY